MKLDLNKEEGNKLAFTLGGVNTSFANAVRRYCIMAVPTYAIEEVTFYENSSPMFDEYISHRVGLVPLTTPDKAPADSEVQFYLDAKGPKTVYSLELESKDKEVKAGREKIPLVVLMEGQSLRLEGKAVLSTSKRHAKFQPGLAAYEISGDSYNFLVESFYQMSPRELLSRAVSALEDDLSDFEKQLEKAAKKK